MSYAIDDNLSDRDACLEQTDSIRLFLAKLFLPPFSIVKSTRENI
jgi:hypothetical protein